jgi:hypothetical protein
LNGIRVAVQSYAETQFTDVWVSFFPLRLRGLKVGASDPSCGFWLGYDSRRSVAGMSRIEPKPPFTLVQTSEADTAAVLACTSAASFWLPARIIPHSAWVEHAPFGFWLVEALRPRTIVELAPLEGVSYLVLCEAVQRLGLSTRCYRVAPPNDERACFSGEQEAVEPINDNHREYTPFSTVIRSSFDDAVRLFSENTIDLLHIDGGHLYEDVKHNFEAWRRKLSNRAIVLFHNTNVREREFGVFQLWEELSRVHPHFEFIHGQGLGVLGVGSELPSSVRALFDAADHVEATSYLRAVYSRLGSTISLGNRIEELESQLRQQNFRLVEGRAEADTLRRDIVEISAETDAMRRELVHEMKRASDLRGDITARLAQADTLRSEIAAGQTKSQVLEERERELEGLRNELAERGQKVTALEGVLSERERELEGLRNELAERGQKVTALEGVLSERERQLDDIIARLLPDSLVTMADQAVSANTRDRLEIITENFAKVQGELNENRGRAARLNEAVAEERMRLAKFESRAEILELELQAIRRSTSWQLTGPMRAIGRRNRWLARRGRQALKLIWWTLSFQLAARLRARRVAFDSSMRTSEQLGTEQLSAERPVGESESPLIFKLQPGRPPASARHPSPRPCILYVTHVRPYPPRAGNEYRIHRMLSWLAQQGWDIVVVVCPLPNEPFPEGDAEELIGAYQNVVIVGHDGNIRHRVSRRDAADAVISLSKATVQDFALALAKHDGPLSTRVAHLTRSFCPDTVVQAALALEAAISPKIVLVSYVFMTRLFPLLRTFPVKAIDTIDVFSTKAAKVKQFGVSDGLELTRSEEAELLNRSDVVVAIQSNEADELRQIAPSVRVISAGADYPCEADQDSHQPAPGGSLIVLIVASGNVMNEKGLRDFLRFAWPLVRRAVPEAKLHVVGSICDKFRSNSAGGIHVLGRVGDLSAHYAEACAVVNPTAAGTGLKIKTLEALSRYRPIVVWPSGVDGLGAELRSLCLVATDWFEFAQAVIAILSRDESVAYSVAQRETIVRLLSPDLVYAELGQVFSQTLIGHSQAAE